MNGPQTGTVGRPPVSIVIPCHDHGRFLSAAIESALVQTYADLEVIVVDDGSTDDTREVAARYPVGLMSQKHAGVCIAANRGIAAARGELVLRLDADDLLAPTYVEETLAALEAHPEADFAYTQVQYIGARGGTYPVEEFDSDSIAERNYVHASALMRRSSFERVGGYRRDMTSVRCEDWDLWLSFVDAGMRGVLVRKPLLHYRQHRGAGRGTLRLSLRSLRREIMLTALLQDHHPLAFAPSRLLRRLSTLPRRLALGRVSLRHAVLLTAFYGVMLLRAGLRRQRATS